MEYFDQYLPFLGRVFLGNTLFDYIIAFTIFIGLYVVVTLFEKIFLYRLKKVTDRTNNKFDDVIVKSLSGIKPIFRWYIAFYVSLTYFLELSYEIQSVLDVVLIIIVVIEIIAIIKMLIDYFASRSQNVASNKTAIVALKLIIEIAVWVFGLLFILSNLGVNVTSLIAGLGIGGIAVALAVQSILEDLLSSFAIYFDRPFEIGDFIFFNDFGGTVEKIGIKTTRIRSLSGEEIIIANNELTSATIQNYRRLDFRRNLLTIGVAYNTSLEKLKNIPAIISKSISEVDKARFGRAHLVKLNDFSMDYEIEFFVDSSEYIDYMDANQAVHLAILTQFEKEGISIPFPTRTVYLNKN